VRLACVAVLLVLASVAAAQTVDAPVERYRQAAERHELGSIRGRVFQERRKPSAPEMPYIGTAISVLPRSETWLFRLNAIKSAARESTETYRRAAPAVRAARDEYEKRLLEAGAGDLTQGATVDAEGRFTLEGLPAGPWVLLAHHATYVHKLAEPRPAAPGSVVTGRPPAPPLPFVPGDKLAGFAVTTYWLREINVVGDGVETVELTDRNAWLTGVVESRQPPRSPDQPYQQRR
jgi:hypothetical protein